MRLLANPKIRPIDVVKVTAGATKRFFVNVAGAGFDSEVNETANGMSGRLGGTGTYIAALSRRSRASRPAHYEITVDGAALSVDAMLAVVGSGVSFGGGMKVLARPRVLDDGLLDVCIVEALSKPAFLRAFPRVFAGSRTPRTRRSGCSRARTVRVEANRKVQVYADGERVGPLPAVFEVHARRAHRGGRARREGVRDDRRAAADPRLPAGRAHVGAAAGRRSATWDRSSAPNLPGFGGAPGCRAA